MTARPQDVALPSPACPTAYVGAEASYVWAAAWAAGVQAALASAQAREEELRAEVAQLDEANRQLHAHGTQIYAELEELRPKCDGLTAEVEHHTAYTITHRGALRYCNSNMRDSYSDEKVRADAAEARAERLAEALREARDYVASELSDERAKFAGYEHCSSIASIEADLARIDALLTPNTAQPGETT